MEEPAVILESICMDVKVPERIAEDALAMARVAMLSGHRDKAIAAIVRAFDTANDELGVTKDTLLSEVLSMRHANNLRSEGILTVGDLIQLTPQELAKFEQLRWRSVEIISGELEKHGFRLCGGRD